MGSYFLGEENNGEAVADNLGSVRSALVVEDSIALGELGILCDLVDHICEEIVSNLDDG